MIVAFCLIGIGAFGIGVVTVIIGMFTDTDVIIKTGIIILLTIICILVLSLIIGGVYMLRR